MINILIYLFGAAAVFAFIVFDLKFKLLFDGTDDDEWTYSAMVGFMFFSWAAFGVLVALTIFFNAKKIVVKYNNRIDWFDKK